MSLWSKSGAHGRHVASGRAAFRVTAAPGYQQRLMTSQTAKPNQVCQSDLLAPAKPSRTSKSRFHSGTRIAPGDDDMTSCFLISEVHLHHSAGVHADARSPQQLQFH